MSYPIDKFLDIHVIITFKVWINAIHLVSSIKFCYKIFEYNKFKRIYKNIFHKNRVKLSILALAFREEAILFYRFSYYYSLNSACIHPFFFKKKKRYWYNWKSEI